jgi:hypothetical protein
LALPAAVFLIFCASAARASTFVTYPESWDIGQAFVVALSSNTSFDDPAVTWLGRTVSLDVEAGREGELCKFAELESRNSCYLNFSHRTSTAQAPCQPRGTFQTR